METDASLRGNRAAFQEHQLALGADFVFVGRPFLYAAAIAGEAGVRHAARLLRDEIDCGMAFLGVKQLAQVGPGMLVPSAGPISA